MDTKTIIIIVVLAILIIAGIIGFILYRKKKQYDFIFKMMEQKKKQEELERQKEAFEAKRAEKSLTEADAFVEHLGGKNNIIELKQCAIRIRVKVKDMQAVDQRALKRAGADVLKTTSSLQLIVGDRAEQIAAEMKRILG